MLSAHVRVICLSSLALLIYPIIHNLVSAHCLHAHPLSMSSVYCLQMHILCTSHFYYCYLHMYMSFTLSENMCIMCTLSAVVLNMFLPNRQCRCHPYIISSTLYISYHIKLSFCTLSTQTHIVNAIWMLSAHVHIICLSSLTLLMYPIIHNLVFAHCLHTHIVYVISILSTNAYIMYISFLLLLFTYVHIICSGP